MEEIGEFTKIFIENTLYPEIKVLLESQYELESTIDRSKKGSNKIILGNRQHTIKLISKRIDEFATERNLDKEAIKSFLLKMVQEDINNDTIFIEEHKLLKEIIISEPNQEKEETREI